MPESRAAERKVPNEPTHLAPERRCSREKCSESVSEKGVSEVLGSQQMTDNVDIKNSGGDGAADA